jgi:hypothetical protein
MPRFTATRSHRLERFAWMVALVVMLRFVAVELHHVSDYHAPGEYCDTCLVVERGGVGAAVDTGFAVPARAASAPDAVPPPLLVACSPPCPLPRGPPSFLS